MEKKLDHLCILGEAIYQSWLLQKPLLLDFPIFKPCKSLTPESVTRYIGRCCCIDVTKRMECGLLIITFEASRMDTFLYRGYMCTTTIHRWSAINF